MLLKRIVSALVLASFGFSAGCRQAPSPASSQEETARRASPVPPAPKQIETPSQQPSQGGQAAAPPAREQELEHTEERQGPFTLAGQAFTVVLHYARLPGQSGPDSQALASLEILDVTGKVHYQEAFPHAIEKGAFPETCSADVRLLSGSNGKGLLIDSGCLPSAPLSGVPGRLSASLEASSSPSAGRWWPRAKWVPLFPELLTRSETSSRSCRICLKIRVWTGYFFVSVPVRVDWLAGKLSLGQHCMYQTGHGFAEEGCEMPAEDAHPAPREQEMTFVRMFQESNQRIGPPAHLVVKKDSKLEVLAGKVLITWQEGQEAVSLSVGEDVWVKVRIDGKEGWIHTPEDLNAIGLFASG